MLIYKEDVLEALENEPLAFGIFAETGDMAHDKVGGEKCKVCAVGAIFRSKMPNLDVFEVNSLGRVITNGEASGHAKAANWMSALSIFWEGAGENNNHDVETCRELAIDFVEEFFPEEEPVGEISIYNAKGFKAGMQTQHVRQLAGFAE